MNILCKTLAAVALTAASIAASAQHFAPLDGMMMPDPEDFVDPALIESRDLGTLPDGFGTLRYYSCLVDGHVPYESGKGYRRVTKTINGKKWDYEDFDRPYVYYIISELPSGARYYGLYTSGFQKLADLAAGKPAEHPYSAAYPVYGTLVQPDGTSERVIQYTDEQWKKLTVSKPVGTYYLRDFSVFNQLDVTFNAGGTGKIVYHLPRTMHQAPQEFGGSYAERYKSGRIKKVHRNLSGGYWFYIDATATQTVKWKVDDGQIVIERTGKPAFNIGGGIDHDRSFANMEITASDRRIEEGKHRQDFPHNEYVLKAKESARQTLEEYVTNTTLYFPTLHITKNEIMVDQKKDNRVGHYYWVLDKKSGPEYILSYCYDNLSTLIGTYADTREYGVKKQYDFFVRNTPSAIAGAPAPLNRNAGYFVGSISPVDRTGKVFFIADGKEYATRLAFDEKWHLDNALVTSSLKEGHSIADTNDSISANNARILEFKKDKRRGKIVKNYEKEAKRIVIPSSFATLDDFYTVCKRQQEMLALQKETLSALE